VITTITTKKCGENTAIGNLPNSQTARGKKGPKGEKGLPGHTGEKGNPGIGCNLTQIFELQQKVTNLQNNNLFVMNLVANLMSGASIGNCIYKFTNQGNYNQARSECKSYGGDLIHRNLGPNGAVFHDKIRAFITSKMDLSRHAIWIGYNDIESEGQWSLVNGEVHDAGDRNQESLYYWKRGQPDNGNGVEDCAHIYLSNNQALLNDNLCSRTAWSSWKFYGLCEVCHV